MNPDLCAFLFACAVFVGPFLAGLLGDWWDRRQQRYAPPADIAEWRARHHLPVAQRRAGRRPEHRTEAGGDDAR